MTYLQWRRASRLLARPQTAPVKARWRHGELWTPKGHPSTLQIHRVAEPWHTEVRVRERCGVLVDVAQVRHQRIVKRSRVTRPGSSRM